MKRISTLDGWRAIAILMVITHHSAVAWTLTHNHAPEPWILSQLACGVDLFFAISGLLITMRLFEDSNLKRFYIRRAARILPPALVVIAVAVPLGAFATKTELISCLTFWRNYLPPRITDIYMGHFWSLSVEEQFYLFWPFLFLALGARSPKVLFWSILAVNLWRGFSFLHDPTSLFTRTDLCADGLLWGCLGAFALRCGKDFSRLATFAPLFLGASVLLWHQNLGLTIVPILLCASVVATSQSRSMVSRILDHPIFTCIGKRSYGLYLWQQPVLLFRLGAMPFWIELLVRLIILVVLTEISYRWIEQPVLRFGRQRAKGIKAPAQHTDEFYYLGVTR